MIMEIEGQLRLPGMCRCGAPAQPHTMNSGKTPACAQCGSSKYARELRHRKKAKFIETYGGACTCCGESEPSMLTIEHVYGGGSESRKGNRLKAKQMIWNEFREAGWVRLPQYDLLCFNCNSAKHLNGGVCPHRKTMLYVGAEPVRAYHDDAGFDLTVAEGKDIPPDSVVKISLATKIKSPEGMWGMMIGRSSTFVRGLLVNVAIIDCGFTGPLFAVVHNFSSDYVRVNEGERIVQWIPFMIHADHVDLVQVQQLPETDRGTNGFGSSGV